MKADGLAGLERRAWLSYHEDGLIDLAFGLLLIVSFAASIADQYRYAAYVILLLIGPLLALAKRRITAPRLGAVQFGPERKARKRHVALLIAALVAGTAAIPFVFGGGTWLQTHPGVVAVILGMLVFTAFAAIAFWLELARMYAVGALFGTAFMLTEIWHHQVPLLVAGIAVAASGGLRLRRFLQRYDTPMIERGDHDG
jgi:hypothetical protein